MIYGIKDRPPILQWFGLSNQQVVAIFVATMLIARLEGINPSASLIGVGLSTIAYLIITKFQSPMIMSNSGAFVAPVLFALSTAGYSGVVVAGLTSALVYLVFGIIFSRIPVDNVYKVFPKTVIGSITALIGFNLMTFIPTYIGDTGMAGLAVALITMFATCIYSHYFKKGTISMFPFLLGLLTGYVVAIPLGLVDFSAFEGIGVFCKPEFAFTKWTPITWALIIPIVILTLPTAISATMEGLADHGSLSGVCGVDLYRTPGLGRIFLAEAASNVVGAVVGGSCQCSYGEGVACVGFSKCSSTFVTLGAAIIMIVLGFLAPVQAFVNSIPACVFAGSAMVLYGYISVSGLRQFQGIDWNISKNVSIVSVILSVGISGIVATFTLGSMVFSISGITFALIIGVILNLVMVSKNKG